VMRGEIMTKTWLNSWSYWGKNNCHKRLGKKNYSWLPRCGDTSTTEYQRRLNLCTALHGKTILFIGDSVTGQSWMSFALTLGVHKGTFNNLETTRICDNTERYNIDEHEIATTVETCAKYGKRLKAVLIRNEHLNLKSHKPTYGQYNCEWEETARYADVIVMNRGTHNVGISLETFRNQTRNTLSWLIKSKRKDTVVLLRSQPVVADCDREKNTLRPSSKPLKHFKISQRYVNYGWTRFRAMNQILQEAADENGFIYFNVWRMTSMWPYAGKIGGNKAAGQGDCVHYCLPGPIDGWVDALASAIKYSSPPQKKLMHDI